jgi:hypothetical protein
MRRSMGNIRTRLRIWTVTTGSLEDARGDGVFSPVPGSEAEASRGLKPALRGVSDPNVTGFP